MSATPERKRSASAKFSERDVKLGRHLFASKCNIKPQLARIKGLGFRYLDYYFHYHGLTDCKLQCMPTAMRERIRLLLDESHHSVEMPRHLRNYQRHLVGDECTIRVRSDIKKLHIRGTQRGFRHTRGLRVRGQRTRTTGRKNKKMSNRPTQVFPLVCLIRPLLVYSRYRQFPDSAVSSVKVSMDRTT